LLKLFLNSTSILGAGFKLHSLAQEHAKETIKVFAFSPPSLEKRDWGRFYYKNNTFNINYLLFF